MGTRSRSHRQWPWAAETSRDIAPLSLPGFLGWPSTKRTSSGAAHTRRAWLVLCHMQLQT